MKKNLTFIYKGQKYYGSAYAEEKVVPGTPKTDSDIERSKDKIASYIAAVNCPMDKRSINNGKALQAYAQTKMEALAGLEYIGLEEGETVKEPEVTLYFKDEEDLELILVQKGILDFAILPDKTDAIDEARTAVAANIVRKIWLAEREYSMEDDFRWIGNDALTGEEARKFRIAVNQEKENIKFMGWKKREG